MIASTLAVAMIVRDEALLLPEFLEAIVPWADQIVVADTGSTDATPAIARGAGCAVYTVPWEDDFAAARNASLDRVTADWVLVLDADERIAAADWPQVRALAEGPKTRAFRFVTRNYTNATHLVEFVPCAPDDPVARGFAGWYPSTKVRLFPNGVGARFAGAVHELVNASLAGQGITIAETPVPVHHYPLLKPAAAIRAKQQYYLELGHQKAAAHPHDAKAHLELGAQYLEVADYPAALRALRAALAIEPANPAALRELGAVLHLLGRNAEARQALELCLRYDPAQGEAWRNLGVVHAHQGAWGSAAEAFAHAVHHLPGTMDLYRMLALARFEAHDAETAAPPARMAAGQMPHSMPACGLYAAIMNRLGRTAEARAFLEGLDTPAARDALARLE